MCQEINAAAVVLLTVHNRPAVATPAVLVRFVHAAILFFVYSTVQLIYSSTIVAGLLVHRESTAPSTVRCSLSYKIAALFPAGCTINVL